MKKILACGVLLLSVLSGSLQANPERKLSSTGFTSSEVCGACHQQIYESWKNSMHALSLDDPIYKVAYLEAYEGTKGAAKKLCIGCHSPTTFVTGDFDLTQPISKEGVNCDFCHSIAAVSIGSKENPFTLKVGKVKRGPLGIAASPAHQTLYSEIHERSALCAGCHEYKNAHGVTILGTFSEWKQSAQSREGLHCQSCHMPRLGGEIVPPDVKEVPEKFVSTHGVAGGHSLTQLKKAIKVSIEGLKRNKDQVSGEVSLANVGSGHAIPTGMPSRRIVLTIEARSGQKIVYREQRVFQKVVVDKEGRDLKKEGDFFLKGAKIVKDTRIGPGEVRKEPFSFSAPLSFDLVVAAQATYIYEPMLLQKGEVTVDISRDEKLSTAQ